MNVKRASIFMQKIKESLGLKLLFTEKVVVSSEMASGYRSPLLSSIGNGTPWSTSSCCPPSLSRQYRTTCVTTKSGLFVHFLVVAVNATGNYLSLMFNNPLPGLRSHLHETIFLLVVALASLTFLMHPVVGLVGEICCKRFRMILISTILTAICVLCF